MSTNDEIKYEINGEITLNDVSNVFTASGIRRPSDDFDRLQRMIENADIIITAWDKGKMVGIARALTDYSYCCYLSDLAVDKDYQKLGIGKKLVQLIQEQISDEVSLILLASPTAMGYYPRIGFDKLDNAFAILRKR